MKNKIQGRGLSFFGFFLCPILTFLLTESYCYDPFSDMKPIVLALNLVFYWLFAALLVMLTGRLRAALRIQTVFFLLTGLANYYVIAFRSSPILPWDIYSAGTAASVADNFSYALSGRAVWVLVGFGALLGAEQLFSGRVKQRQVRAAGGMASLFLMVVLSFLMQQDTVVRGLGLYDKMFTPGAVQKRNGSVVAFLMELRYLKAEKPPGYDAGACQALLDTYGSNGTEAGRNGGDADGNAAGAEEKRLPNMIVIMDESFADMAYIGDLTCNTDPLPYFHSMLGAENTLSGRVHVSVLGGNTANTEFEFLTGNTMAFLPSGSVPYQQHIRGGIPSLADELKKSGYHCIAMHPYHGKGWNREQVYPWLGFDEMRFLPDFTDPAFVRKYVSDRADFAQLITEYERRDRSGPLFLFNVTMQNHGGYDQEFSDFTPEICVEDIESHALSNYLSLISLTDQALAELIAYFEREPEDTMILFFGDHQPNDTVAAPILRQNGLSVPELTPEQEMTRYEVPFLLWANFDIAERENMEISANFLALEMLRQAGLPLDGYYGYLAGLQEQYPVISGKEILTADGRRLTEEEETESEALLTYRKLQYYRLFDAASGD